VSRCKEKYSQCRMTDVWGELGADPLAAGGKEAWRLAIFTIFNKNNTFLGIFRLKFLLKIFS